MRPSHEGSLRPVLPPRTPAAAVGALYHPAATARHPDVRPAAGPWSPLSDLGEQVVRDPVRDGSDGQAGGRTDGPRHHGAIRDVQPVVAEDPADVGHDALPLVAAHRAAAERM